MKEKAPPTVTHSNAPSRVAEFDPSSISSTLLDRAKARRPEAWRRLVDLYGPTVYRWCRKSGIARDEAADVVQEVFTAVAVGVVNFRRDRPDDSFGAWLGTITRHKISDHFRRRQRIPVAQGGTAAHARLQQIPESLASSVTSELDEQLPHRALELIRAEFEDRTWQAFRRAVIDGHRPAHIAEDLGMSVDSVYQAKSRVLRRLRRELG